MKVNLTIHGRPMSKKNTKKVFKIKGRYIPVNSKSYIGFEVDALWQLRSIKNKFTGPIIVDYVFYMKGRLDTDVDNMMGGINDILQKSGLVDNDKNILKGTYEKIPGNKDWRTEITITSRGGESI